MGFWSKVWQKTKAIARTVIRIIVEVIGRILGVGDLLLGFLNWPRKKLRLHIVVLSRVNTGPIITKEDDTTTMDTATVPVININDLNDSIEHVRKVLKKRFNIKLEPYGKSFVEIDPNVAPDYALNVKCDSNAVWEEYDDAGEFFAKRVAGWNAVPVSGKFPITAFVVGNVDGKQGCSLGPLTDYVTIDPDGVASTSTLMHEIGHACGLWHSGSTSNIMYKNSPRGDEVKWFQKNLLRSSRHVLYW